MTATTLCGVMMMVVVVVTVSMVEVVEQYSHHLNFGRLSGMIVNRENNFVVNKR